MSHPPSSDETSLDTPVFRTVALALAVEICERLKCAHLPARLAKKMKRLPDGRFEVRVPAEYAGEALQLVSAWMGHSA